MIKMFIALLVVAAIIAIVYYLARAVACRNGAGLKCGEGRNVHSRQKVRVAFISGNSILLCPRDERADLALDNLDVPFETVIGKHESVERSLARIFAPLYRENPPDVRFCMKHRSACGDGRCESYLFMVLCEGDDIPDFVGVNCKLWTRRQIEANLGLGVFSAEFEEEYPHLRLVVDTWSMMTKCGA